MSQDMYAGFFGLSKRPFTLVPDPDFLFWSAQHRRAFAVLEFGVMSRAPITLITGDVGAGKTTLVHALLARMTDEVRVGLISNAQGDRGELLQWAMNALGMELHENESYVQMFRRLQDQLIADYAAGRRVILIFDEAQNLSKRGLEELRMFTNINSNQDELLQLILVGQPELRATVQTPEMRQLAQRVAANFHLEGLDEANTAEFIAHRLRLAGGTGEEFSGEVHVAILRTRRDRAGADALAHPLEERRRRADQDAAARLRVSRDHRVDLGQRGFGSVHLPVSGSKFLRHGGSLRFGQVRLGPNCRAGAGRQGPGGAAYCCFRYAALASDARDQIEHPSEPVPGAVLRATGRPGLADHDNSANVARLQPVLVAKTDIERGQIEREVKHVVHALALCPLS